MSLSIVDRCLEEGINFFDTAEVYTNHTSEAILGKALEGRRRDAIVASKFGGLKEKQVRKVTLAARCSVRWPWWLPFDFSWMHTDV